MKNLSTMIVLILASIVYASASEKRQPYKGYEGREISSLSPEDIASLEKGTGWSLALPAELNGYPGPMHILDLSDELALSKSQEQNISLIHQKMKKEAVEKGRSLIQAELRLDQAFRMGDIDMKGLQRLIQIAETARGDLRFVHLSSHLMTIKILNADQIENYSLLRGYLKNLCKLVPDGHNEIKWRLHNKCRD